MRRSFQFHRVVGASPTPWFCSTKKRGCYTYNPIIFSLSGEAGSFSAKKGDVSPIFGLWPRKCFFPYARLRYRLQYTFGEECKPVPLLRLYIFHFHGFYVHVVDPHVVMSNTKNTFQLYELPAQPVLQRISCRGTPIGGAEPWFCFVTCGSIIKEVRNRGSASSPVDPL